VKKLFAVLAISILGLVPVIADDEVDIDVLLRIINEETLRVEHESVFTGGATVEDNMAACKHARNILIRSLDGYYVTCTPLGNITSSEVI